MIEMNELRHLGKNDQSDMIKPFTALLEGKKLRVSPSSEDPGTRSRDSNSSALAGTCCQEITASSNVATDTPQSSSMCTPQRKEILARASCSTMCTYFNKPCAPSPLVNTPLSGKKLPILSRTSNGYLFYAPNEENSGRKGVSQIDSLGSGDSFICPQPKPNKQEENSPLFRGTLEFANENILAYNLKTKSPLMIASLSLPLIKKNVVAAIENDVPPRASNTDTCAEALKKTPEIQTNTYSLNPIIEDSRISQVKRLHVKPFNVLGTRLRTNRKTTPKPEMPKYSKVKYCRGVSYNGANYAYCLHAPYRARFKGVAPELSVCPQYVICYHKQLPPKKFSRTEQLFTLAKEKPKVIENIDPQLEKASYLDPVYKNVIPAPRFAEKKKRSENFVVEKKRVKTKSSPENFEKKENNGSHCRPVTVSGERIALQMSLNDRPAMKKPRSSSENRLALHDDFPFHCFLLFQFEDRDKVMKRLTKLPERMQQSLLKRKKSLPDGMRGLRPKSRNTGVTPSLQYHPKKRNSMLKKAGERSTGANVDSVIKQRENALENCSDNELEGRTSYEVLLKHKSQEGYGLEEEDVNSKLIKRSDEMWELCSEIPLDDERWHYSSTTTETPVKPHHVDLSLIRNTKEEDENKDNTGQYDRHENNPCVICIGDVEETGAIKDGSSNVTLKIDDNLQPECGALDTPWLPEEDYRDQVNIMDAILLNGCFNETTKLASDELETNCDNLVNEEEKRSCLPREKLQHGVKEISNVASNCNLNVELSENRTFTDRLFTSCSESQFQRDGQKITFSFPCISRAVRRTRSSGHLCEINSGTTGVSSNVKSLTRDHKMDVSLDRDRPSPLVYETDNNTEKTSRTPNLKCLTTCDAAVSDPGNNRGDGLTLITAAQTPENKNVEMLYPLSYRAPCQHSLPVTTTEDSTAPTINNLYHHLPFPRHMNTSNKTRPCSLDQHVITLDREDRSNISFSQMIQRSGDLDGSVKDKKLRMSDPESPDSGIGLDSRKTDTQRGTFSIQDTYVVSETLLELNIKPRKHKASLQRHTLPTPYRVANTMNFYKTEISRESSRETLPKVNDNLTTLANALCPMSMQLTGGYKTMAMTNKMKQSVRFKDLQNIFEDDVTGTGRLSFTPTFPTGNWATSAPAYDAASSIKRPSFTLLPTIASEFWTRAAGDKSKGQKLIIL